MAWLKYKVNAPSRDNLLPGGGSASTRAGGSGWGVGVIVGAGAGAGVSAGARDWIAEGRPQAKVSKSKPAMTPTQRYFTENGDFLVVMGNSPERGQKGEKNGSDIHIIPADKHRYTDFTDARWP